VLSTAAWRQCYSTGETKGNGELVAPHPFVPCIMQELKGMAVYTCAYAKNITAGNTVMTTVVDQLHMIDRVSKGVSKGE
jgi:hypothetical protein